VKEPYERLKMLYSKIQQLWFFTHVSPASLLDDSAGNIAILLWRTNEDCLEIVRGSGLATNYPEGFEQG
jgi:hypothetical protein